MTGDVKKRHLAQVAKCKAERRCLMKGSVENSKSDKKRIQEMYLTSSLLGGMNVDHIVPIRGILPDGVRVNGKHVISNLQIIDATDNKSKNNKITYQELSLAVEGYDYVFAT